MRVYVVKSDYDSTPLAEVRTDTNSVEFTVDNTDGALPAQCGRSWKMLVSIVSSSPHLSLEEPKGATAQLLRYELSNGDIIEITTDAKTVILNGRLLSDAEKRAILTAIANREVTVSKRADPMAAVPVLPKAPHQEEEAKRPTNLNMEVIGLLNKNRSDKAQEAAGRNASNDDVIDDLRMTGMDPLQESMAKNMLYSFRYGKFKGEQDAD